LQILNRLSSIRFSIAPVVLAIVASAGASAAPPADTQGGPDAAPTGAPGPGTEIIGPDGSFRLKPAGVEWARFQTVRAIGVSCTEKACGGDRVFCMIQVRNAVDAKPGESPSHESAKKFGDGVIASAPKELRAEFVTPFGEKTLGANPGRWAEAKAEGEAGAVRFGLFLLEAKAQELAFNCVAPLVSWDVHRPRIEAMLSKVEITK
jgi:hypothetical protein